MQPWSNITYVKCFCKETQHLHTVYFLCSFQLKWKKISVILILAKHLLLKIPILLYLGRILVLTAILTNLVRMVWSQSDFDDRSTTSNGKEAESSYIVYFFVHLHWKLSIGMQQMHQQIELFSRLHTKLQWQKFHTRVIEPNGKFCLIPFLFEQFSVVNSFSQPSSFTHLLSLVFVESWSFYQHDWVVCNII